MKKSYSDSVLTAKRSNRLLAVGLTVLCTVCASALFAQDYARLSERTLMGTARYVGMGGAMSAIGGDPSAVLDNPAGLGLYRRMEVMLTMDHERFFMAPQASIVVSMPTTALDDEGPQFVNFMFSYHRLHSFSRNLRFNGNGDASLGALLARPEINWDIPFCSDRYNAANSFTLYENGSVNVFAFDWSMNISNRWFVGAGLNIQTYTMSSDAEFYEAFAGYLSDDGKAFSNTNVSTLMFSGVSCSLSAGLIYRPLSWLRLGFGIETPTLGNLRTYTSGKFIARTDSLRTSYAPELRSVDKGFHMPLHTSTSVAFQIGAYGLIALQYDYRHASFQDDVHSLRAGFEVIPVLGFYINGGYVYESSFRKTPRITPMDPTFDRQDTYSFQPMWSQYASVALGYRGPHVIVQAAYQYHWQQQRLYPHEAAQPFNFRQDTHRIVLTLAWHQE